MGTFTDPVMATSPAGDGRLFVVERAGRIRVLGADGVLAPRPFLDIAADVVSGGEQGLLGLAFAPDYARSGHFFVYLTAAGSGEIQIRRYTVAAGTPNRADPGSAVVLLRQAHDEYPNHNGGTVRIGPDGKLWAGLGDGGGGNNSVLVRGQYSAQSPFTLLGKLVRLELDGSVPADNPVAGSAVWQSGLRNPYRFSFDRGSGSLLLGDVGQGAREELDIAPAPALGRGVNWGWPCREGTRPNVRCTAPGAVDPSFELSHDAGAASIIGGVLVRDLSVPDLYGRYLYTDIAFPALRSLAVRGALVGDDREEPRLAGASVVSIDEDGCGRVVVTSLSGPVSRLVDGRPRPCLDPADPYPPVPYPLTVALPAAPGGGPAGCTATVTAPRRVTARALRRRGVPVRVVARSACTVTARVRVRGRAGDPRRVTLVAGERRALRLRSARGGRRAVVTVRLTRAGTRRVRDRRFVVRVRR